VYCLAYAWPVLFNQSFAVQPLFAAALHIAPLALRFYVYGQPARCHVFAANEVPRVDVKPVLHFAARYATDLARVVGVF
jgi:hypothetical protein